MTTPQVEKQLTELRKLSENKECLNCHSVSKMGHGNVCVPFKTFVCGDCKSAHQAFSHRIKSLTMSIWTQEEVDKLKPERGGSNRNAEAMYFARYDERKLPRPRKGDDHTVWKDFIKQVYIDKRFFDDAGGDDGGDDRRSSSNSRRHERSAHESSAPSRSKGRYDDEDEDDYSYNNRSKPNGSRYNDDKPSSHDDRSYSRSNHDDRRQNDSRSNDQYSSPHDDYDSGGHRRVASSSSGRDRRYDDRDDEDDGEVRARRKDVGKSRLSSRTSKTADRNPASSSARHSPAVALSGKNDLLGDWDADQADQLSKDVGALDLGGHGDSWADFAGASHSTAQSQPVQQNLFETTPQHAAAPSTSAPMGDFFGSSAAPSSVTMNPSVGNNTAFQGDIMAMYNMQPTPSTAPVQQRPSPMGMATLPNMGSMGGMPSMGSMGVMPSAPMAGMAGMGMQYPQMYMAGMPHPVVGGIPQNPSVMGGMGMGIGMGMQMRGPSPMQHNMAMGGGVPMATRMQPSSNSFARQVSNEPSVFDLSSNTTPGKPPAQKQPGARDAKFGDLRW